MSQDTGSASSNSQKVDIDDIEVSILIIAKNSNRVSPASTFLNRRGWPTTVTNNLGRAIEMISDTMPDFVMVSYNYNHPALAQLPDMVVGTFNLSMIGFAELMDAQTKAKLMSAKVQYRLTGQPSGPNIQRFIRKILAERYQIDSAEDEAKKDEAKESRRELAGGVDTNDTKSSGPMIFQKGGADPKKRRTLKSITGNNNLSKEEMFKAMERFSQVLAASSEPEVEAESEVEPGEASDQWGAEWPEEELSLTPGTPAEEELTAAVNPPSQPLIERSPMQLALEQAMGSSFQAADAQQTIEMVERVAVFPVNSSTDPGYLVVAWEGTDAEDKFLQTCHESLARAFQQNKLLGDVENGFWVQIPQIDYWQWVKSASKFFFSLAHNQSQLGTAFFSLPEGIVGPKPSEHPGMIEIAVEQIATNQPVNFKAYLRLKENDKFYLYLRNGRQLMPEQKQRLIERNIRQFSLKTVDYDNLRIFLASSFLLSTIKSSNPKAA